MGQEHLETPMLDSKTNGVTTQYCDIIVISEHIRKWEKAIDEVYSTQVSVKHLVHEVIRSHWEAVTLP